MLPMLEIIASSAPIILQVCSHRFYLQPCFQAGYA
jgi:hypothetical protein